MKISIVIPNYNGEALLKKNIPKVLNAVTYYREKTKEAVEIIVVDDFSSDNSITMLRQLHADITILQNEKNMGFSSTINCGVKEAKGEIVVLLNTDVIPEKDFLLPLIADFEDEQIVAVGCMDKSMERGSVVLRGRGVGTWTRGLLMHERGEVNRIDTLWVSGGSSAMRKSVWDIQGGFNPLYNPFYWEDIDFSYRCIKSGYKILFEPKSVVVHQHETGSIKSKYSPNAVKIIAYRNQFIFAWVNITDFTLFLSHIVWLPYHIIKAIFSADTALIIGFFQAILKLRKILETRTYNKKSFVKTDKEVIGNINI